MVVMFVAVGCKSTQMGARGTVGIDNMDFDVVSTDCSTIDLDQLSVVDINSIWSIEARSIKWADMQVNAVSPVFSADVEHALEAFEMSEDVRCSVVKTETNRNTDGSNEVKLLACVTAEAYKSVLNYIIKNEPETFLEQFDIEHHSYDELVQWLKEQYSPYRQVSGLFDCSTLCYADRTTDIYLSITHDGRQSFWKAHDRLSVVESIWDSTFKSNKIELDIHEVQDYLDTKALYVRTQVFSFVGDSVGNRNLSSRIENAKSFIFAGNPLKLAYSWNDFSSESESKSYECGSLEKCKRIKESYLKSKAVFDGAWHDVLVGKGACEEESLLGLPLR